MFTQSLILVKDVYVEEAIDSLNQSLGEIQIPGDDTVNWEKNERRIQNA